MGEFYAGFEARG